jgi:hypothetical protein
MDRRTERGGQGLTRAHALLWIFTATITALIGCKAPEHKPTEHELEVDQEQRAMTEVALTDLQLFLKEYQTWYQSNQDIRISEGHQKMLVDTFANRKAAPTYGSESRARQGAAIAHHAWRSSQRIARGPVWFMIKMPTGYDATFGDWFYAEVDPSGTLLRYGNSRNEEISRDCISCHARAEATDFLFGARSEQY